MAQVTQSESIHQMRIEDTPLPNRARRWLRRAGIRTVGELTQRTEADLLTIRNFAETSLEHVKRFLAKHGLSLAPPREEECPAEWVRQALADPQFQIPKREREVLKRRHGIDQDRPMTLEEAGREFNLTRERIRQIQAQAIRKLRHAHQQGALRTHFEDG